MTFSTGCPRWRVRRAIRMRRLRSRRACGSRQTRFTALVQTVLVQDEALKQRPSPHPGIGEPKRACARLKAAAFSTACAARSSGKVSRKVLSRTCGLPKLAAARSGTAVRCCSSAGHYDQGGYGQPYGGRRRRPAAADGWRNDGRRHGSGGGGSFLGTAAASGGRCCRGLAAAQQLSRDDGRKPPGIRRATA